MGVFTPNIGLFIPSQGEQNYADSFATGMINLDQHDHSGGPNKGLPVTTTGLADFSVTFNKLASNVADITTGIGTNSSPGLMNQLQMLGVLRNLFTFANGSGSGLISINGSVVAGRTLQDSLDGSITWTFPDGVSGNPLPAFNIAGISPVPVANGGTGVTSFNAWDIICGGATSTGPLQQVSGEGTTDQYLASQGPSDLPIWKTLPAFPTQNYQIATLTLTASQFNAITSSSATNVVMVPAQGAGKVVLVDSIWGKVNYGSVDPFHGGSSVRLYYANTSNEVGYQFASGAFKDSYTGYYYAANTQISSPIGIPLTFIENRAITIGVNSSSFTGGSGNTVTFSCQYSVMQI